MSDPYLNSRVAETTAVCLIISGLIFAGAFVGAATAEEHEPIIRESSSLQLSIDTAQINATGVQEITVGANGTAVQNFTVNLSEAERIDRQIPLTAFKNISGSLRSTSVTVSVADSTFSSTVDLRYFEIDDTIIDKRVIAFQATEDTVVGIQDGDTITVDVVEGGNQIQFNATYRDGAIRIPVDALRTEVSLYGQLSFSFLPNLTVQEAQLDLRSVANLYIRLEAERANVSHPLMFVDEKYIVVVLTENPSGKFTRILRARGPAENGAYIRLPEEVLLAEQIEVQISNDGQAIYNATLSGDRLIVGESELIVWNKTENESTITLPRVPASLSGVWIASPSSGVPNRYPSDLVTGSTLDVTATSGAIDNGTQLILIGENQYKIFRIETEGDTAQPDGASSEQRGLTETITNNLLIVIAISVVAVIGIVCIYLLIGGRSSSGTVSSTYTTKVQIVDETGTSIQGPVSVKLSSDGSSTSYQSSSSSTRQLKIAGGSETVELPEGTWTAQASYEDRKASDRRSINHPGRELVLQFEDKAAGVEVVPESSDEPITGADVTAVIDGKSTSGTTNSEGRWQTKLPLSASSVEIQVDHELYESKRWSPDSLNSPVSTQLALRPLTGTIVGQVCLNGTGIPNLPVSVTKNDGTETQQATTDSDGAVEFTDVPIGKYTIQASLGDCPGQFSADNDVVDVRDGETSQGRISVSFDYNLPASAVERIREIQPRVGGIGSVARRDSAIPAYYASVIEETLDTIHETPTEGYTLLTLRVDPDELIAALLDAVERATETIEEVMTSKRNVDLFSACSDLPAAEVSWNGEVSVARLKDLAEEDIGQQRGEVLDKLEDVDNRISDAVSEISEVSPAREMWEGIRTMIRDSADASKIRSAALIVVAEALLDAIAGLFEHEQLRQRMERTVY